MRWQTLFLVAASSGLGGCVDVVHLQKQDLEVSVVDAESGEPIQGAEVTFDEPFEDGSCHDVEGFEIHDVDGTTDEGGNVEVKILSSVRGGGFLLLPIEFPPFGLLDRDVITGETYCVLVQGERGAEVMKIKLEEGETVAGELYSVTIDSMTFQCIGCHDYVPPESDEVPDPPEPA